MSQKEMVDIYILGKKYSVPESLTIMDSMEYAGYKLLGDADADQDSVEPAQLYTESKARKN